MPDDNIQRAITDGFTTEGGLLYEDGRLVPLPAADHIANDYGFMYVEQFVKALEALK